MRDKELDCMIMCAQFDLLGDRRAREAAMRWGVSTEAEIEQCLTTHSLNLRVAELNSRNADKADEADKAGTLTRETHKGRWSKEEDAMLVQLVAGSPGDWAKVAKGMAGRTAKQCIGRWRKIDPIIV